MKKISNFMIAATASLAFVLGACQVTASSPDSQDTDKNDNSEQNKPIDKNPGADGEKEQKPELDYIIVDGLPAGNLVLEGHDWDLSGVTVTAFYTDGTQKNVEGWTTVLEGDSLSAGQKMKVSYSENDVTKTYTLLGRYYTAASDALTETVELLPGYDGTFGTSAAYYKFGDYPQSVVAPAMVPQLSSKTVYNGWNLGDDGYFYEKAGDYWYKVEPIVWRKLSDNYGKDGKALLMVEKILEPGITYCQYSTLKPKRVIDGVEIEVGDYKYSNLRYWLNGKMEEGDTQKKLYGDRGFLQAAFSEKAQELIAVTEVDNYLADNPYMCENTMDKVFVLSVNEWAESEYGFGPEKATYDESHRIFGGTDYAFEKGLVKDSPDSTEPGFCLWTRSPMKYDGYISIVFESGNDVYGFSTLFDRCSPLPAICVDLD